MTRFIRKLLADFLIGASLLVALTFIGLKVPELWNGYQTALNFIHGKLYVFVWHATNIAQIEFPVWMGRHYIEIEYFLDVAGLILIIPLGFIFRKVLRSQIVNFATTQLENIPLLGKIFSIGVDAIQILVNTVDRLKEEEAAVPVLIFSGSGIDEVGLLQFWGDSIQVEYGGNTWESQTCDVWVSGSWKVVDLNQVVPLNTITYREKGTDEWKPFKVEFSNLMLKQRTKASSKDESMSVAIEVARVVAQHLADHPDTTHLPQLSREIDGKIFEYGVSQEFLDRRNINISLTTV